MTALRQRLIEDMQLRNFSPHTVGSRRAGMRAVAHFPRHHGRSPEQLSGLLCFTSIVVLASIARACSIDTFDMLAKPSQPLSNHAAPRIRSSTCSPAAVAIFTKASRLKRLILPRRRSEMRGWVTPNSLAACACVIGDREILFFNAIINSECSRMFSASSAVSSMASHTLENFLDFISPTPVSSPGSAVSPNRYSANWSCVHGGLCKIFYFRLKLAVVRTLVFTGQCPVWHAAS
jgi:hypothetical protein